MNSRGLFKGENRKAGGKLAFRCREQYLEKRGQKTDFKFKSRWHKEAKKAEKDKPTLGERVEQQNKK